MFGRRCGLCVVDWRAACFVIPVVVVAVAAQQGVRVARVLPPFCVYRLAGAQRVTWLRAMGTGEGRGLAGHRAATDARFPRAGCHGTRGLSALLALRLLHRLSTSHPARKGTARFATVCGCVVPLPLGCIFSFVTREADIDCLQTNQCALSGQGLNLCYGAEDQHRERSSVLCVVPQAVHVMVCPSSARCCTASDVPRGESIPETSGRLLIRWPVNFKTGPPIVCVRRRRPLEVLWGCATAWHPPDAATASVAAPQHVLTCLLLRPFTLRHPRRRWQLPVTSLPLQLCLVFLLPTCAVALPCPRGTAAHHGRDDDT